MFYMIPGVKGYQIYKTESQCRVLYNKEMDNMLQKIAGKICFLAPTGDQSLIITSMPNKDFKINIKSNMEYHESTNCSSMNVGIPTNQNL